MKLLGSIVLLLCLGVTSCGVKLPTVELDVTERIEEGAVVKTLFTISKSDSLASTINYSFYSKVDSLFKDSINGRIQRFIVGNTVFSNIETNQAMSRAFVVNQLDSFAIMYESEVVEYAAEYDAPIWNLELGTHIDESRTEFVELSLGTWSYTGGAHGNGFSQINLIDYKTGKLLTLADFFSNVDQLTKIGETCFRLSQDLEADYDLTEAGFWFENGAFHLNENFSFEGDYIKFFYNQYEIAPYSAGTIEFEIPLDKIKHLLKRKID